MRDSRTIIFLFSVLNLLILDQGCLAFPLTKSVNYSTPNLTIWTTKKPNFKAQRIAMVYLHGITATPIPQTKVLNLEQSKLSQHIDWYFPMGSQDELKRHPYFGWDAGNCCIRSNQNHQRLVDAILKIKADYKHLFLMGFSNGGHMVLRLIAELGNKISGGISFSGTTRFLPDIAMDPARLKIKKDHLPEKISTLKIAIPKASSLLLFHNMDDQIVPFDGGYSSLGTWGTSHYYLVKAWSTRLSCDSIPKMQKLSETSKCSEYLCKNGKRLVSCTSKIGGHSLSGSGMPVEAIVEKFIRNNLNIFPN